MGIITFNHFEAFALASVFFTLYNFKRLFEGEFVYKVCMETENVYIISIYIKNLKTSVKYNTI
jgi:hypothetical protein